MRKQWLFLLLIVLLMGGDEMRSPPFGQAGMESGGVAIRMSLDKLTYGASETVRMGISIINLSAQPVTLHFNSGQRYDFLIKDESGKAVYQWSADKRFTMALGSEKLGGVKKALLYSDTFKGKLKPGRYTLTGKITSRDFPMEATLTFMVTPTGQPDNQPSDIVPIK